MPPPFLTFFNPSKIERATAFMMMHAQCLDAGPHLALVCVSPALNLYLSICEENIVYLRGEHCLFAGRTLSKCGENIVYMWGELSSLQCTMPLQS